MGCNVIATRHCGNWELCPPELLVSGTALDDWVRALERGCSQPYPSRIEGFCKVDPAQEFVELAAAL